MHKLNLRSREWIDITSANDLQAAKSMWLEMQPNQESRLNKLGIHIKMGLKQHQLSGKLTEVSSRISALIVQLIPNESR